MSIAAMNWAMAQSTGSPSAQCVLYVIADVANPEGIGWPSIDYIAKRSQQSADTVRRRLKDLETGGYLVRFERHDSTGRRTSDEIRLQMGGDAVSVDPEPDPETGADGNETNPENGAQKTGKGDPGKLRGAPGTAVPGGPSQWCEGHSEPSNEPLTPQEPLAADDAPRGSASGGKARIDADLSRFLKCYPIPTTRLAEVRQLFGALAGAEPDQAVTAAMGYRLFCERNKRKPIDAAKFLRDPEQWAQFVRYAPSPKPERVFLVEGSDEWRAWGVLRALMHGFERFGPFETRDGQTGGWFPELPAGALSLADFAAPHGGPTPDWPLIEFESRQWWAWVKRARLWGAELFEADMVDTGETYQQKLPGGRVERWPVRVKGLRFPLEWPPPLAGTTHSDKDDGTGEGGDDGTQNDDGNETGSGSDPVAAAGGH